MNSLCSFTNLYFTENCHNKPSYSAKWAPVNTHELDNFTALLFYMSIINVPNTACYWSQASLYSGLWTKTVMSKSLYRQINSFLKITDFTAEDHNDELSKVRYLYGIIKSKCKELYHPSRNISIGERILKGRQYNICEKSRKQRTQFWILADSSNGYTYDFDLYLRKEELVSVNGLGYDVVMKLCNSLFYQGYRLFMDNFYTCVNLFLDLLNKCITAFGTISLNSKRVPVILKDSTSLDKTRGSSRYVRDGNLLFVQWRDHKIVNCLSTI